VAFQGVFSRLPTDYLGFVAGDPGVIAAYEALHRLHVLLVQNRSWEGVQEIFGVAGRKGCVRALAETLTRDDGPSAVHPRVRAPLHAALMDFFRRIVGGDPVVLQTGSAAEVIAALDPKPFQSISALFFGAFLGEILRLEDSSLTKLGRERLRSFALEKANRVVAAFERKFKGQQWKDCESGRLHPLLSDHAGRAGMAGRAVAKIVSRATSRLRCRVLGVRTAFEPREAFFDLASAPVWGLEGSIGRMRCRRALSTCSIWSAESTVSNRKFPPTDESGEGVADRGSCARGRVLVRGGRCSARVGVELPQSCAMDVHIPRTQRDATPRERQRSVRKVQEVVLFSGGMDSACGAGLHHRRSSVQLVSF